MWYNVFREKRKTQNHSLKLKILGQFFLIITLNLIVESIYQTSLLKDTKKINNKQKNALKRNNRISKYIAFKYINTQGEDKF